MISYSAVYVPGSKPYLAKVLTVGGESMEVKLGPSSGHDELDLIPTADLFQHLENYISYIQDETAKITVYQLDDPAIDSRYPFKGYVDIDETALEATKWWQYIFFHRETDGTPA